MKKPLTRLGNKRLFHIQMQMTLNFLLFAYESGPYCLPFRMPLSVFRSYCLMGLWHCSALALLFTKHELFASLRHISIIKALKYYIFSCFSQPPLQVKYTRCSSTVKTAFPCYPHIRFSHILGMTDWTEYKLLPGYSPYPSTPSMWSSFSSFSKFLVSLQYGMY